MEPENLDIEAIAEARRESIEQTVQEISVEELKSIGEKIFPSLDHPWRETFFQFLEENKSHAFYHATRMTGSRSSSVPPKKGVSGSCPEEALAHCKREDFRS